MMSVTEPTKTKDLNTTPPLKKPVSRSLRTGDTSLAKKSVLRGKPADLTQMFTPRLNGGNYRVRNSRWARSSVFGSPIADQARALLSERHELHRVVAGTREPKFSRRRIFLTALR